MIRIKNKKLSRLTDQNLCKTLQTFEFRFLKQDESK